MFFIIICLDNLSAFSAKTLDWANSVGEGIQEAKRTNKSNKQHRRSRKKSSWSRKTRRSRKSK